MKTIAYTNNQGLELKINKFSSGQFKWAFSLTFNNGVHPLLLHHDGTQDHPTEKRDDPEMGSQCKRQV